MILNALSLFGGRKFKLLVGALGILGVSLIGIGGYVKGSSNAAQTCAEQRTESVIQGENNYDEAKREVMGMSPSELDRYLSKWMR